MDIIYLCTRVIIASIFFCLVHCQCSDQDPELIFNGISLKFCDNAYDEFYNCLCQDNTQRCTVPYQRAADGNYSLVSKTSITREISATVSDSRYYRCNVPSFYEGGTFWCNKLPDNSYEVFNISKSCTRGRGVTISWSYGGVVTRNWINELINEPGTMTKSTTERPTTARPSVTSAGQSKEPTRSQDGSMTTTLRPDAFKNTSTTKAPSAGSEEPSTSQDGSIISTSLYETSMASATLKTSSLKPEKPLTSQNGSMTTTSKPQKYATTLKTPPNESGESTTNQINPQISDTPTDGIVPSIYSATSVSPTDAQYVSEATTLANVKQPTVSDTTHEEPTRDQDSSVTISADTDTPPEDMIIKFQESTSDDDDVITNIIIGCSVAGVLIFIIILLIIFCIKKRREHRRLDSSVSEEMDGNFRPWAALRGNKLNSQLISNLMKTGNGSEDNHYSVGHENGIGDDNMAGTVNDSSDARLKQGDISADKGKGVITEAEMKTNLKNEILNSSSAAAISTTRISVPDDTVEVVVETDIYPRTTSVVDPFENLLY